jgi:hypothetical protein
VVSRASISGEELKIANEAIAKVREEEKKKKGETKKADCVMPGQLR